MHTDQGHPVLRQLPTDWAIVRVDDLFTIQQGKQVSGATREGNRQRPFLRTRNVYWGRLDFAELDAMHFSEKDEQRLRLLPGDLLTCEGGWVGRTAIWNGEAADCLYQNHLHRLRRLSNETDPQFALYWFWYAFEIGEVYFGRENVTTIPNLSKSRLGELPMPSPSRDEQRRIAAVLAAVQRAIERQERLIGLAAELKRAVVHKLFTAGTRGEPLKQTEIGSMPESWTTAALRDLCAAIADCPHTTPEFVLSGVRVVRNYNIRDGQFVPDPAYFTSEAEFDQRVRRAVPTAGDVLFSREAPVGEACVIPEGVRTSLGQRLMLIRTDPQKLDPHFLVTSFYSPNVRTRMLAIASGLTTPHLNVADVRNLVLPIPSISDQLLISGCIKAIDRRLTALREGAVTRRTLFRTLLRQLMSAEIRVHDLDLSALEVEQEPVGAM